MRLLIFIAIIAMVSCGQENQTKEEKLQFQRQSLVESGIQCAGITTDITNEKITCPSSFISEEKVFLFSIDEKSIDQDKLKRKAKVHLTLLTSKPIQGYFYLVSKYGKKLSDDVLFDGVNTLTFEERRVGDFSAHDVYLKLANYFTGGDPVAVKRNVDKSCDTGLFNVEDINLEDLRGQCPNLKFLPNLKARAVVPVYKENKNFNMSGVRLSVLQLRNGSGIHLPVRYVINYRIFSHMEEQLLSYETFYNVRESEFGFEVNFKGKKFCQIEGIINIKSDSSFKERVVPVNKMKYVSVALLTINGKRIDYRNNIRVRKCYPTEPILTGTVLIKE